MTKEISDLKKILIIRLSSMGDILLTTPLIRSIKKQNPNIQIDFVVKSEFFELLKNNPHLTNIYKYSKNHLKNRNLLNSLQSK